MRSTLVSLLCLVPALIAALPAPAQALPAVPYDDVWQDDGLPCPAPAAGLLPLTSSSRTLYVNDCLPGGCTVTQSNANSALTNTSSISDGTSVMSPYMHGQAHWDEVIACVRETFAPFDINVVTDDPGQVPHYEVMTAGTSAQLSTGIMGAGGIAPFISCNAQRDSVLVFVFANQTDSINYLCAAIVHEAGHAYGLSHSLDARDPMTYMELGGLKRWQNADQTCGTTTPENCRCFPSRQNSFRYLTQTFGLAPGLEGATVQLVTPRDGMWVKPGFPIRAGFSTPLETLQAALSIDGGAAMPTSSIDILAWNAPASIAAGAHQVAVTATDFGDRTSTATATVNVMQACAAGCADGFGCLGGFCVPGSAAPGGLGASCTDSSECSLGQCATSGDTSLCTASCDPGGVCPSGFACDATANVCWPSESGGCSATGGPSASLLFGVGALVLGMRRRRAR